MYRLLCLIVVLGVTTFDKLAEATGPNCCSDLPEILADLNSEIDALKKENAKQQKQIDNCETQLKKVSCVNGREGCYKVILSGQSWVQSKAICENMGGYLVQIDSANEHNDVVSIIKSTTAQDPTKAQICQSQWTWNGGMLFHIGARRTADVCSAKFVWTGPGNNQRDLGYTNWHSYEPSCGGSYEHCTQLVENYGYLWNDINCGVKMNEGLACPVCEFNK